MWTTLRFDPDADTILVEKLSGKRFPVKTPSNLGNITREINLFNVVVCPPLQAIDTPWKRSFTRTFAGSQDTLDLSVVLVLWLCIQYNRYCVFYDKKRCVYFPPRCNFVEDTSLFSNFTSVNSQQNFDQKTVFYV